MARQLRIGFAGAVYHITNRVNAKQDIFIDNTVRKAFLKVLAQVVNRFNRFCYVYYLVNKYYNLSVETIDFTLSRGMRQINWGYAQFFNHRHKQTGHLFPRKAPGCFGRRCWIARRDPVFPFFNKHDLRFEFD